MVKRTSRHGWLILAMGLVSIPACSASPAGDADPPAQATAAASAAAAPRLSYDPAEVTPPAGASGDVAFAPLAGEALERARLPLDAILQQIEQPAFLVETDDAEVDAEPAPAPPLAATRAYARGRAAYRAGDVGEAVNQLRLAQRLAPRVPDSYRLLGRIRSATRNLPMAEHEYEQAARLDPGDLETLVMLGRFAQEQQRQQRAIALFAAADQALQERAGEDDGAGIDRPGVQAVIDYQLATALASAGYAAAARQRLERFLDIPREEVSASIWARQLAVIDRQSEVIHRTLGDLHLQLGEPEQALRAYERAVDEAGPTRPLVRRLVFAHLRLGQPDAARQRVIQHVAETGGSDASLDLVRYLVRQGLDAQSLATQLRELYGRQDASTPLALALADLLPPEQAEALLGAHLRRRPSAEAAYEKLLQLKLGDRSEPAPPAQIAGVLLAAADAMAAAPEQARQYGAQALAQIGRMDQVAAALEAMSADQRQRPMVRVLEALSLLTQQQVEPATQILQQTLADQPDNRLARIELIRLLMLQDRLDAAAELLGPLENSDDPQIVQLRVQILSQTGQAEQALALLDRLMENGAAPARLYLEKARLQLRQQGGDAASVAAAEQTLLDGLNVHPQEEAIFSALFEIYEASNETGKWQALMRRLLGSIPQSRLGRLKRAEWLAAGGQHDQAETLLRGLLEENPADIAALDELLDVFQRSRQIDEARKVLDRLLADDPNNVLLLSKAGDFYREINDVPRMIAIAERLVELRPASEQRIQHLALLYLQAGEAEKAVNLLQEKMAAGQLEPNMVLVYQLWQGLMRSEQLEQALTLVSEQLDQPEPMNVTQLAEMKWRTLLEMDRPADAEQALRQTMQRFPAEAGDLGYQLASVITRRGDRERALQLMAELVEDHPEHAGLNNDLAYQWAVEDRHLDRALQMAQRAVEAEPENPAYLDTLGWAHYKQGQFEEAVTRLRQAAAMAARRSHELRMLTRRAGGGAAEQAGQADPLAGTRAVVADHLGDALYRLGREDQALRAWKEALEHRLQLSPEEAGEDPDLQGMVERLGEKIAALEVGRPAPVATAPGAE